MDELRVGDYGSRIQLNIVDGASPFDLSGFTGLGFVFRKPDGSTVEKTALMVTDGTDGSLYYIIEDGLLNMPGIWRVQAVLTSVVGVWHTSPYSFEVKTNL